MLEAVGIDPDAAGDRRPGEFSGGQCQRISIARALMAEPELLDLRRAGLGPRRVGAGPDPQSAGRPQGQVRPHHGLHRPRPGRGQERERPGGGDVPGQAGRGGRLRRAVPVRPPIPTPRRCWPPSPSPTPTTPPTTGPLPASCPRRSIPRRDAGSGPGAPTPRSGAPPRSPPCGRSPRATRWPATSRWIPDGGVPMPLRPARARAAALRRPAGTTPRADPALGLGSGPPRSGSPPEMQSDRLLPPSVGPTRVHRRWTARSGSLH